MNELQEYTLLRRGVEQEVKSQATVPVRNCRVCESTNLDEILSLGNQYVSDFVTSEGESPQAPLVLVRCKNCGLVQLKHTFSRVNLYRHYWYKSGISPTMRQALADLVSKACRIAEPSEGDLVIDIGCNDGTLLRSYTTNDLALVGFEPAENLVQEAKKGTNLIINDFFSAKALKEKLGSKKARIVTSVAMFYDLEDPNRFVADVTEILAPRGIWVVQQNYLATMLEQNGFDNIGHEHLEYYTLETMQWLLEKYGLEIFDAEINDVNGGSFRTFISRKGEHRITPRVLELKAHEARLGLRAHSTYESFGERIRQMKREAHEFIVSEIKKGKTIYVYGASNRGNTILQYYELDHNLIKKATDANPEKWGRKTAGTLIPIISKDEARLDHPDYFLILPHHFLNEITRDEREYLEQGGKFIVPLPQFKVLSQANVKASSPS